MGGNDLRARYAQVRGFSEHIAQPLCPEDTVVQTMPDVSPTKWHLAHTTWAFETFVLSPFVAGYEPFHPAYSFLFNSYYNAVGPKWDRPLRGVLSRPTLDEVRDYRRAVDGRMQGFLDEISLDQGDVRLAMEVALHHEQQHQELMLTDLKHVFASNPLRPIYREAATPRERYPLSGEMVFVDGGLVSIGHEGDRFAFDNECPRHRVFVEDFELAVDLVTNREYAAFVDDGGYRNPALWLDDGWHWLAASETTLPLYWRREGGELMEDTLAGPRPLDLDAPVTHVSFYEADAFARWSGKRLPTEAEWETGCVRLGMPASSSTFVDDGALHPVGRTAPRQDGRLRDMLGEVWEWTSSAYHPYPGYRPLRGVMAEYNGKFMNNQRVLRGGSCVTSRDHVRPTYRNFFQPEKRWQFTGIRLARDAS